MVMGGTTEATLNITYNYGGQFAKVGLDFHEGDPFGRNGHTAVHGKIAADLIPQLRDAVEALRMEHDTDYWKPTPGNAGYALSVLLGWAQLHPDGIFRVS